MSEKKTEIERRVTIVADFKIDEHQVAGPNEQIFGAEIAVDEAAAVLPYGIDQPLDRWS